MLPIALLLLAALFALLMGARVGGARRTQWLPRWPALLFAGAAIVALFRGAASLALGLAALAVLAWVFWPAIAARQARAAQAARIDVQETEARTLLGVGANATESEIRAAFRQRMRHAHPDRGGSNAEAARLTAARDRLLKKT